MIPSGYKEDVVYSAVPTDGSGDLSFTRSSNGTRIDSAGNVQVVPWNLLQYSEDFSNAYWSKSLGTLTANVINAPNGTLTADLFTKTSAVNTVSQISSTGGMYSQTGIHTLSVYAKQNVGNLLLLRLDNDNNTANAQWDFSTKSFTNSGANIISSSFEELSNGWFRLIVTGNVASTTWTVSVANLYSNPTNDSVYIWGAQINLGTLKPYFPTTDRLNVPRLTYQNGGGGCPSLLLEKQSTNLALYSEQLDNAGWTKSEVTISANNTTSPDGTQNADKIISNTTNARHIIYQEFTVGVSIYTFTTYAKAGGNSFLIMRLDTNFPEVKTWFNLSNGTIGTSEGGSPSITSVGNGWYRCSVQFVSSASQVVYAVFYTATTDGSTNFAGNGTDGTFAWGAQLEASSYPTSYIPTTSSSATRVADECTKNGIGALIGGTSGTVFFDIKTNSVLSSANYKQFCYYLDSASAQSYMYLDTLNQIRTSSNWGSLGYSTAFQPNTRYKVALVYAPNDFALYINGISVATASSGTPKNNVDISIGQLTGTENCEFVFNQYTHFPSRLTNTELASLTTI